MVSRFSALLLEMGRSLERARKLIKIRTASGPKEGLGKPCVHLYLIYFCYRTWIFCLFVLSKPLLRALMVDLFFLLTVL